MRDPVSEGIAVGAKEARANHVAGVVRQRYTGGDAGVAGADVELVTFN